MKEEEAEEDEEEEKEAEEEEEDLTGDELKVYELTLGFLVTLASGEGKQRKRRGKQEEEGDLEDRMRRRAYFVDHVSAGLIDCDV